MEFSYNNLFLFFVDDSSGSAELSNDFKETSYLSIQNEVSQPNLSENDPQNSNQSPNDKKNSDDTPAR